MQGRSYYFSVGDIYDYDAQRFGLGLIVNPPRCDFHLEPGAYHLRWWLRQAHRPDPPTQADAVRHLAGVLADLP